jgi:hypothetical protein
MKIIIYVLCYDEYTENVSRCVYGIYPWCRIFRMPEPSVYLEFSMYTRYLQELRSEWADADFVGTLSWKAYQKVLIGDIAEAIASAGGKSFVPFFLYRGNALAQANHAHPLFSRIWVRLLSRMGYPGHQILSRTIPLVQCNYWMAKPDLMQEYINFAKKIKQRMDETSDGGLQALLYSDSQYRGQLSKERLVQISGKPYYTYHPFICERLPGFFFRKHI